MNSVNVSAVSFRAFGPALLGLALTASMACSASDPTPSATHVDGPVVGDGEVGPGGDGAGNLPTEGEVEGPDGEVGAPGGDGTDSAEGEALPGGPGDDGGGVEPGGDGPSALCPDGSARPLNGECADLAIPDALVVHELSPTAGPIEGGTEVTITGSGFTRPIEITFGGHPVLIDPWRNNNELRFPSPDVKQAGVLGFVDVEIRTSSANIVLGNAFNYFDQIRLNSISQDIGATTGGDRIRLDGAGFDDSLVVSFGDLTAADVEVVSPGVANVTTPKGTPGLVDVRVFTDNGRAVLEDAFTYVAAVTLDSVSPNFGPLEGSTIITLSGTGFSIESTVRIGLVDATVLGASEDGSTLTANTPRSDRVGARDVRVIDEGGEAILIGAFSYYDDNVGAITVHAVVPPTGSTRGGELVKVVGNNFDDSTEVTFDGEVADCSLRNEHLLECRTPAAGGPGLVDVTAEGRRGGTRLAAGFQYRIPLEITTVSPGSGPVAGGTRLTVRGAGFDADTNMQIGVSQAIRVQVLDPTTLIATAPPGSAGPADIRVERPDGAEAISEDAFQYTDSLRLLAVTPDEGAMAGGTIVTLLGTGFVPGSRLTFGGAPAEDVEVPNGASLTAVVPPGEAGDVDVVLTTPGGEQAMIIDGFTYFNPSTRYGGTWGDEIDGAVNITVFNANGSGPIAGAFCILGTERGGDYEGLTDQRGQITFSGDDVFGRQMITCGAQGFSNASVVRFDAENVSVYLFPPPPPPSPGPMGPGPEPATVSGLVWGIDKYLKPLANPEEGWEARAYVQTTTEHMYADRRPDPGEGWIVHDDGPSEIRARLGDLAVVAIGGLKHVGTDDIPATGEFRPIRMGAARWLFGITGERIEGANIELNIPMDNVAGLRFDSPPVNIDSPPDWMVVEPTIIFDADGAYPLWQYINVTGQPIEAGLELHNMPSLVNALEDTTLTFRVEMGNCDDCRADPRSISAPYTETYVREVRSLAEEIDVTPILGIPRLVSPAPGGSHGNAPEIRDNTIEWEILGGSDLPTGQNNILFKFNAQGDAVVFWDMYFRGDQTSMVLPAINEVHGVQPGEQIAILFISTYVDGFDLDNFEYGDFGRSNRRAQSLSVGWMTY